MIIERSPGQFEYWDNLWVTKKPVTINGKDWIVKSVICASKCLITLIEA